MFLKVWINFSIYSKGGANFKKLEMARCFNLDYSSFLKFLCTSKKKLWEKERKKKRKKKKKEIS